LRRRPGGGVRWRQLVQFDKRTSDCSVCDCQHVFRYIKRSYGTRVMRRTEYNGAGEIRERGMQDQVLPQIKYVLISAYDFGIHSSHSRDWSEHYSAILLRKGQETTSIFRHTEALGTRHRSCGAAEARGRQQLQGRQQHTRCGSVTV
jgi:hypothetical protein